eukprot:CAMPEP_0116873732 /NCGR_PEP_ID=MMETSP0463-20121206/5018_1 /TAXON_ID=181622 /ORGANISM="Strombidinopsis sp, Strain SopsisLIS2011" /LENGTH=101 /DNA_ID=CAMNT_0004516319 /DNA_START=1338 /DNA_END=1640 /DNA_ORIENTATION=+
MYYSKEYVVSPVDGIILPPDRLTCEDFNVNYDEADHLLDKDANETDKLILDAIMHDRRSLERIDEAHLMLRSDMNTPINSDKYAYELTKKDLENASQTDAW